MWVLKLCVLTGVVLAVNGSIVPEELPSDVEEQLPNTESPHPPDNITYSLYNSFTNGAIYYSSDKIITEIDPSLGTVILIDGHNAYLDTRFRREVREALTAHHNFNVIVMDWTDMAFSYSTALLNLEKATEDLVQFLELLQRSKGSDSLLDVHLVAFGIGSHLAGAAGFIYFHTNPIGRITGLDPTRREFRRHVLRRFDAQYVEIIHTNGIEPGGTGFFEMSGDVNFIPNGGLRQPGCLTQSCSHNRAWQLFLSSLQFDHLIGRKCDTITQVFCRGPPLHLGGVEITKDSMIPGNYRLNTRLTFPF